MTGDGAFGSLAAMVKLLLVSLLVTLAATSCTTLSNRRDLYNPSEDAGPYHSLQQPHPTPSSGATPAAVQESFEPVPR